MKDPVGPHLLKSVCGSVYGLSGGGEGTGSQHLNLLHMTDFGSGVNYFLLGFEELLSEVAELQRLSFDERVS